MLLQAAAIAVGRLLNLHPLAIFFAARIVNGLTAVAISCIAIRLAGCSALVFFVLLCFPMSVHQMGSLSADATMIPLSLLLASLSFLPGIDPTTGKKKYVWLAVVLALLAQTRFPLLGLIPLLWLPAWKRVKTPITTSFMFCATSAACLFFLSWFLYVAHLKLPMRADLAGTMGPRVEALVQDPLSFFQLLSHTVEIYWQSYLHCMVGVLGWLDSPIPVQAAHIGELALVAAFAYGCMHKTTFDWRDRIITLGTVLTVFVGMQLVFHLSWSPVGSTAIQGFQGRYFLTFIGPLVVPLSASRSMKIARPVFFWSAFIGAAGCLASLPYTLMCRFYLQ
ncbi:MAG: DUF2142 domain-containing protein [Hymenobacter sp.]|nr:MAG: DUF2142 domain-containing protein [Hymenobacter sp.]